MAERVSETNIYDVAERAGVSKSTVSRVLNMSGPVKEATRRQVEAAMEELGFRPNASARRLAGSVDKRIGLLFPFFGGMFSSFYVHEVLRGVGEVVSERDAELLLHIDHSPETGSSRRKLEGNGALGGWLIADETVGREDLTRLRRAGTPFALLNRSTDVPGASFVVVDNRQGAREAMEHILGLGHRRVAVLTGALANQPAQERLNGCLDALKESGVDLPDGYVVECNFLRQRASAATAVLLARPDRPTAVVAASDLMAAGACEAAAAAGLRVPGDISVVGFDDDVLASQLSPGLTTVRQPLKDMASKAASWLLDCIEGRGEHPLRKSLEAALVVRESCAPPGHGKA